MDTLNPKILNSWLWQRADRSAGSGPRETHWSLTLGNGKRVGMGQSLPLVASDVSTSTTWPVDSRIALFLMGELVAALRADDSDLFRRCLSGGVQDLGEPVV